MNYYDLLGVAKDADEEQVRKSYKKAASRAHPDKGGTHEAFLELQAAYETLMDPFKRKIYDLGCPGATLEQAIKEAQKELATLFVSMAANLVSGPSVFTRGFRRVNPIDEVKNSIENGLSSIRQRLAESLRTANDLKAVHSKLKKKDGATSFLHAALNEQRKNNWVAYRELQKNRKHLQLMLNLADMYDYEMPSPPDPFRGKLTMGTYYGTHI